MLVRTTVKKEKFEFQILAREFIDARHRGLSAYVTTVRGVV